MATIQQLRIITFLVLLALVVMVLPVPSAAQPSCQPDGDIDRNGRVTAADALLAFQKALSLAQLNSCQQTIADVFPQPAGPDGIVTASDALCISQKALSLSSCLDTLPSISQPPVAYAGPDQFVDAGTIVMLSGTGSDPDGTIASYGWTQVGDMMVTFSDSASVTAVFTAPDVSMNETLTFRVTVTDNFGAEASDEVMIVVRPTNKPPIVNASVDQSVDAGAAVTLTGSASDPDGTVASYAWIQTGGTLVTLIGADSATAAFTAPDVTAKRLTFRLTVTDNEGVQVSAELTVRVQWYVEVSAGREHACGLRETGTVECWGDNYSGQSTPPAGTFASVSAGGNYTCGVRDTGEVSCWGSGSTPAVGTFTSVSVGKHHTCGVRDTGDVSCWGSDSYGKSTPPAGTFISVSAGEDYTCGVRDTGEVSCWGQNYHAQSTPPVGTFTSVSAGSFHTCGVRDTGDVLCWGDDGKRGFTPPAGTFISINSPAGTFTSVSAGEDYTCGVRDTGEVLCWGSDSYGQSTPPAGTFTSVSAGSFHTCGVRDTGDVLCWGDTAVGQSTPPAGTFTSITANWLHTCGVRDAGDVSCWGQNYHAQSTPPAGTFTSVSAGGNHTCGVRDTGDVSCWGQNYHAQSTPPAGTFTSVSAGSFHTCGVRDTGDVSCWGQNYHAQSTPPAGTFTSVSAGAGHTCGVRDAGDVSCWGSDGNGQSTPPAGTFTSVSAGAGHTCGVRDAGDVSCWGSDGNGQSTPPAGTFTSVSAGGNHTCGVRDTGDVLCWGDTAVGQSTPPAGTFTSVSAGAGHTCGVRDTGDVSCWGTRLILGRFNRPVFPGDGTFITSVEVTIPGAEGMMAVGRDITWIAPPPNVEGLNLGWNYSTNSNGDKDGLQIYVSGTDIFVEYWVNGIIQATANYRDGKPSGSFNRFTNGELNGVQIEFFQRPGSGPTQPFIPGYSFETWRAGTPRGPFGTYVNEMPQGVFGNRFDGQLDGVQHTISGAGWKFETWRGDTRDGPYGSYDRNGQKHSFFGAYTDGSRDEGEIAHRHGEPGQGGNSNRPPESVGSITDIALTRGVSTLVVMWPHFTDPDDDWPVADLTYNARSDNTSVAVVECSFHCTIRPVFSGTVTITVTATDPGGLTAVQEFKATVVNRPPLPVPDNVPEEITFDFGDSLDLGLNLFFWDPDGFSLELTYFVSSEPPKMFDTFPNGSVVASSLRLDTSVAPSTSGQATVTACDPEGLCAQVDFGVLVQPELIQTGLGDFSVEAPYCERPFVTDHNPILEVEICARDLMCNDGDELTLQLAAQEPQLTRYDTSTGGSQFLNLDFDPLIKSWSCKTVQVQGNIVDLRYQMEIGSKESTWWDWDTEQPLCQVGCSPDCFVGPELFAHPGDEENRIELSIRTRIDSDAREWSWRDDHTRISEGTIRVQAVASEAGECEAPSTAVFRITDACDDGEEIYYRLFQDDISGGPWTDQWPQDRSLAYVTRPLDSEGFVQVLCPAGKILCYGAESTDARWSWGVGLDGTQDCPACCRSCPDSGEADFYIVPFICDPRETIEENDTPCGNRIMTCHDEVKGFCGEYTFDTQNNCLSLVDSCRLLDSKAYASEHNCPPGPACEQSSFDSKVRTYAYGIPTDRYRDQCVEHGGVLIPQADEEGDDHCEGYRPPGVGCARDE